MNLFELFVKIGVDDQASGKLESLSSKLGSGLKIAAKAGAAAVAAVGSGIAALGTYAAKVGGDFEAQMSKVSAISGATGDDLQALEDKAKQLGIDTKFSATEAGQAFEYMAMAGWKTEQMLDGVAGIMDLAAASGEDLASVSDIVTDAMTAFGLSAEDSTHFADVLAAASSNANTNVGLMGETFKYVAPVAGAMGYSIEDTAVAIGLLANAGIKGSQAGTSLRAMFSRLSNATADNAALFAELDKQMQETGETFSLMQKVSMNTGDGITELEATLGFLGISASDAKGNMRPLEDVLDDVKVAMRGLTQEEQAFAAKAIAGQEAMSGLLAIVNASEADINKLTEAIDSADGSAKQMADTMANNLQGQLTLLKSSAEGFGLALYDKIQVPLTEMASWAVESLNELTTAFNEDGVNGLVTAAGNILSAGIAEIINGLPKIVDLAIQVIDSFIDGIDNNLDTIVNGAFSIVITLANGILEMLPKIVALGLDLIVSLANGIAQNIGTLIPTVVSVIMKIAEILTNSSVLQDLLDAAFVIINELAWGLSDAIPQLTSAVNMIIETVISILLNPKNIASLINAAVQIILALGSGLINTLPELARHVDRLIMTIIAQFKDADWKGIGKNLVAGFKSGIQSAWSNLKTWFSGLFGDLKDIAKRILGIRSPSKEFKKLGVFTAEGFGLGFQDEFANVKDDMEDAMSFDEPSIGIINASIRKMGAGAATGAYGSTTIGSITINVDGAKYADEQSLAAAIAQEIQSMTDRRTAVYA